MKKTKIKLMQGDCLERMKEIPDGSVDMVLTDPPYGTTICKWDTVIPIDKMWDEIWRVCKPNAAVCLFGIQPFTTQLISSNIKDFRYCWYWEKERGTNFVNSYKMPMKKIEDIMTFYKKLPYYDSQGEKYEGGLKKITRSTKKSKTDGIEPISKVSIYTHRRKTNILKFTRDNWVGPKAKRFHPTQKPVPLLKYLIETYTQEGETVLDFTMGSGSTGVACIKSNRSFIGIELDEKYFNVAKERLNEEKI